MKVFIVGPASADHETAIERARARGCEVVGIVDLDDDRHGIQQRTEALFEADVVVALPGWKTDPASLIEVTAARAQRIRIEDATKRIPREA